MENNQDKKSIYQERERYRQKAFLMMLEMSVIIALPAFVAFFLGRYLEKNNQTSSIFTLILFFISFIFSWVIIIRKYISFNRKVKRTDKKILKLKDDVNNSDRG